MLMTLGSVPALGGFNWIARLIKQSDRDRYLQGRLIMTGAVWIALSHPEMVAAVFRVKTASRAKSRRARLIIPTSKLVQVSATGMFNSAYKVICGHGLTVVVLEVVRTPFKESGFPDKMT